MEINFVLGKNGGHTPKCLGGRSIAVFRQTGRQADKIFIAYKIFKIWQLQFWSMFRLFEWIYGANKFVPLDELPVFEGNIIVRLVFQTQEAIYSLSIPIIKYYDT